MIHLLIQNMYPRSVSGQCPQPKALMQIWIRGWWVTSVIFITGTSSDVTKFCFEILCCGVHSECDGGHQKPHVPISAADRCSHFALHAHWLINWVSSLRKISDHLCITTCVLATGSRKFGLVQLELVNNSLKLASNY